MGVNRVSEQCGLFRYPYQFYYHTSVFLARWAREKQIPDSDSAAAKIVTFATKFQFGSGIHCMDSREDYLDKKNWGKLQKGIKRDFHRLWEHFLILSGEWGGKQMSNSDTSVQNELLRVENTVVGQWGIGTWYTVRIILAGNFQLVINIQDTG